jgi:hypothetical protein
MAGMKNLVFACCSTCEEATCAKKNEAFENMAGQVYGEEDAAGFKNMS